VRLDEAIKDMHTFFIKRKKVPDDDIWDACRLGLEALKEIQRARLNGYRFAAVRLPGETED
jgi:hypothetical protein